MAKRKEIKFKKVGVDLKGERNGLMFRIFLDYERAAACAPAYYVAVYSGAENLPQVNTQGRRYFHVDDAKEFCRQIAAGEIATEALQAEFAAADAAKEQADIRSDGPYEFYIDGEPAEFGQPVPEATELELDVAVRCAKTFQPDLVRRYSHAKKKRIRKKYAKRILIWYWGVFS